MAAVRKQSRMCPIARILTDVCEANAAFASEHDPQDLLSSFESSTQPPISVANYMRQVERVAGAEYWPQCLILIDELSRVHGVPVSELNVHRLIVTAYSLVLKLDVDGTGLPPIVAQAGRIEVQDLVEMECAFLQLLDWRVYVGATAHQKLVSNLRIVRETARAAAKGPKDGPVTLIPAVVVSAEERFSLQGSCTVADKTAQSPASSVAFVPCPPKTPNTGGGRQNCDDARPARPSSAPQARADVRRSAGKRIASAQAFALVQLYE
eukprot:TRINITY_DN1968_c0_g1_i8.p1 TRINITY_DN1968_c0_g1~~TRINITY_DN1968_c0_g1_i8.p1  ORF type:complete len:294 (+),score=82.03 TRINITY_DN1968_c0_g1_i8:87-884(+)